MLGVSLACTITLVIQVANVIASAITERSAFSTVLITLIIEIAAAVLIIILFNPQSEFNKRTRFSRNQFLCFRSIADNLFPSGRAGYINGLDGWSQQRTYERQ